MSFEDRLNRIISEAPVPPDRAQRFPARRGARSAPKGEEFASVRKSIRKPIVNLDAAIHEIDKMLNTTQQDPSKLGDNVTKIEKSFNSIFEPIRAVRDGVTKLRQAVDKLGQAGFEYRPEDQKPGQQQQQPAKLDQNGPEEDRFLNRIATDIEMSNRQDDKAVAVKQGFEAYQQSGGKMNRGEFVRRLIQKLRLPGEGQEEPKRKLSNVGNTKRYGATGTRRGKLQFRPGRTSPIESSVQRRKLIQEGPYKHYSLGQLQQEPAADDSRLINKVVTAIETVNNLQDKKSAFRNGWVEYQSAGGKMAHSEFAKAVGDKLKAAHL